MSILADELRNPQYENLSDQAAADTVNAKTVTLEIVVPIWQVKEHAIVNGYWPLVKAGQLDANSTKAGLCLSVIDWIDDPKIQTIDVHLAAVQQMLSGLTSFGLMSNAQAAEIVAMGYKTVSWTSTVGLPEVGVGLVRNARKEMGANS